MAKQRFYWVYIMANAGNNVLYTGMPNNLIRRVYEHRNGITRGFAFKYNVHKLVYYEVQESALTAIKREKQLKAGSRKKKHALIEAANPNWRDLYDELSRWPPP